MHTGLRTHSHNLDKLVRYCSLFSYKLPDLFPKDSPTEAKRFGLLQKAYLDARYAPAYYISYRQVEALTTKAKALHALLQESGAALKY